MTLACAKRVRGRLDAVLAMMLVTLLAAPALAEQPAKLLRLRDSDRSAHRADHFDLPSGRDGALRGNLGIQAQQAALQDVVVERPSPRWTTQDPGATRDQVHAPVAPQTQDPHTTTASRLAWGLTGTGASIFTGALLYQLETRAQRDPSHALTPRSAPSQYRNLHSQLDQTRKFVLALYAVGGSMFTGGIVLMATDDDVNGEGFQAKLAPAWMNGGPAARLKVSF